MTNLTLILIVLAIWNGIVFLLYGMDKRHAKQGRWRTSENTLLVSAIFMGGIGAFLGMRVFHHKTKHLKFIIGVPLAAVLNIAIIAAAIYLKVVYYANIN